MYKLKIYINDILSETIDYGVRGLEDDNVQG